MGRVVALDVQVGELAELRVQLAVDAVVLLAVDQVLVLRETELTLRQTAGRPDAAAEGLATWVDENVRGRSERRDHECARTAARGKAALRRYVAIERRYGEVAIGRVQLGAMSIARGEQDVVCIGLVAPEQVRRIVAVTVLERRVRALERQSLEAAPRNEVHDARDRVRAVSGCRTVLQHFDAFDRAERQQVHIDAQQRDRRHRQAPAIEQHERSAAVETAQIDADRARAEQHTAGVRLADRSLRRRQRANHIEYRGAASPLDLVAIDHGDRKRRVFNCTFDIGTGHDDLLDRLRVARCVGSHRGRRECREQSSCNG